MDLTIEGLLKELVKQGATFAGFANLAKWNDNSKGSFVNFALDMFDEDGELRLTESPFKGCLEGAKDGQRFYLVAIMAANPEPEEKPKSFAGQAKGMAKRIDFCSYVDAMSGYSHGNTANSDNEAEYYIENFCGVTSCSEIIEGTEAGRKFKQLQAQFLSWKDQP